MEKTTVILTRKIQIKIDLPTAEEKKEVWQKLYTWQDRCVRAANLIISHLYVQAMIKDFFYLSEGIKYKLVDEKKNVDGILQFSHSNCTYRVASDRYKGDIPTNILNYLNHELKNKFKKNYMQYASGTRSLDNFKPNSGFLFGTEGFKRLHYNEDKKAYCFRLFTIPFKTYLGNDFTDKHKLLQKLMSDEVKLCTSRIKLDKGKIFWLAAFEITKDKHYLKPEVVAEASLSLEHPISVKIGKNKLQIGNKEEFLHRRLAIQAAYARTQLAVTYCRSGKGKERKLKALTKFKDKEANYITNRLHEYSRRLIDFCVKHQAATLVLMDMQENTVIAKEEQFVLRNWNYYELMTLIKYKADKAGIELITT
ncbi:hypothetical protein [Pseudopedobacter sp.]|uniref:hypothetical protein n=1 Tax=Pseudopedobacter sp. TaxID=1936787 RepID=UPI00334276A7